MPLTDFLKYFALDTNVDIRDDEYVIFKGMLRDFPIELEYRNLLVLYADIEHNILQLEVIEL